MKATRKVSAPPPPPEPTTVADLRRRAEKQWRRQPARPDAETPGEDLLRLVHELQVHQIELELQNEDLLTAREAREKALLRYADLYDFAPVGYMTLDRSGVVLEANLAAGSLLGLERSRLIRRRLALHVAAAERPALLAYLTRVFAGETGEACEVTLQRDGRPAADIRIEAAVDASGEECRCVLEDITGQKQAEADRLVLSKLESTSVLADGLSHDFNNLLTVILLNIEMAQSLGPPTGRQADMLAAAKRSTLVAGELSRELNRFARAGLTVDQPTTALARVIREAVRPVEPGSGARCNLSLPENLWPTALDEDQIRTALVNVVQNARESMPPEGVVFVRAENVVLAPRQNPALPPGDYVQVSITDHGGGIAKAMQTKVFDPYFSTKRRGNQRGTGLGLAISHSVIRSHGGAISVESVVGAGTTFHLHLPATQPSPEAPPRHA